jgi:hypothetical protein
MGGAMADAKSGWSRTLLWGAVTAILYLSVFAYADDVIRLARTTTNACVVGNGAQAVYYNKPTLEACAEKGGTMVQGNWLFVFIPILIAFAISYIHGAFTSNFWDSIGLKAASKKK